MFFLRAILDILFLSRFEFYFIKRSRISSLQHSPPRSPTSAPSPLPRKRDIRTMISSSPEYAMQVHIEFAFQLLHAILTPHRTKPGVRPLSRKRDKPLRTYGKRSTATPEPRSEPPAKRARTACTVLDDKNIKPLGFIVPEDHVPTVVSFFKAKPQSTAEQGQAKQSLSKPGLMPSAKRSILNYFRPTAHLMPIEPGKANNLPGAGPVEEQTDRPVARPKRRLLRIRLNQSLDCDDEIDQEQIHNRKSEKDESKDVMEGKLQKRSKRGLGGGSGLAVSSQRSLTKLGNSCQLARNQCKAIKLTIGLRITFLRMFSLQTYSRAFLTLPPKMAALAALENAIWRVALELQRREVDTLNKSPNLRSRRRKAPDSEIALKVYQEYLTSEI
ncbi:hypothetical protein G3M48_000661 [Beauveria asiatica]|uniref:Uncharacterized protein n=1 Tax=Beauveria asiatica TaxID=1069075 RepID=A0AAW0S092_9HYPO